MVLYALLSLGLLVYAVVDLASTPARAIRTPKWLSLLAVLLLVVAPLAWLLLGRPGRTGEPAPEPTRTVAPDDDEDFLRELRRRAADPRDDVV